MSDLSPKGPKASESSFRKSGVQVEDYHVGEGKQGGWDLYFGRTRPMVDTNGVVRKRRVGRDVVDPLVKKYN